MCVVISRPAALLCVVYFSVLLSDRRVGFRFRAIDPCWILGISACGVALAFRFVSLHGPMEENTFLIAPRVLFSPGLDLMPLGCVGFFFVCGPTWLCWTDLAGGFALSIRLAP